VENLQDQTKEEEEREGEPTDVIGDETAAESVRGGSADLLAEALSRSLPASRPSTVDLPASRVTTAEGDGGRRTVDGLELVEAAAEVEEDRASASVTLDTAAVAAAAADDDVDDGNCSKCSSEENSGVFRTVTTDADADDAGGDEEDQAELKQLDDGSAVHDDTDINLVEVDIEQ